MSSFIKQRSRVSALENVFEWGKKSQTHCHEAYLSHWLIYQVQESVQGGQNVSLSEGMNEKEQEILGHAKGEGTGAWFLLKD